MRAVLCAVAVGLGAPGADWVGRTRLRSVQTIDCLQRLQSDPHDPCAPKAKKAAVAADAAAGATAWSTGNFPKPLIPELQGGDAACGSHGELFCDPDGVLTEPDQRKLARTLQMFRENSMVKCRMPWMRSLDAEGTATARPEDEHQFRVGVALVKNLPPSSLDEQSLEVFGDYLLSTWEVTPRDCAAGAVLIVVPNAAKAWLVAPSCEYVCGSDMETGGRVLNVLESSLGWRATGGLAGKELESADYLAGLENALHELEDVMHEHRGMAFANGRAVVMPDPDVAWRMRKEREWSDVAPWIEGGVLAAVVCLFGYMAHWYTMRFFGEYLESVRVAFKGLGNTG